MKKLFAVALAAALALSMSTMAFAVTTAVKGLDDYPMFYEADASKEKFRFVGSGVVPYGETVYYQFLSVKNNADKQSYALNHLAGNFITEYDAIRGTSIKQQWEMNGKAVEKVEIVKKKFGPAASDYAYYLAVKLRSSSSVKKQDVVGTITLRKTGTDGFQIGDAPDITNTISHSIGFTASYPESEDTTIIDEYRIMFTNGSSGGEETIYFSKAPDNYFDVDTRGQGDLLVKADTKYNYDIAEKYPTANLDFFNCYDVTFNRVGELTIAAEKGSYLYQVKGDSLTPVKFVYDEYEGAFKVKTRTLGNYVISDRKLSNTTSPSSSEPSSSEPASSTPTTTTPTKPNPSTGANA